MSRDKNVANLCCVVNPRAKCSRCGETRCSNHGPNLHSCHPGLYPTFVVFVDGKQLDWKLIWTEGSGWTI